MAEPVGSDSYRVLTFESHPQVVGQLVKAVEVKSSVGGRAGTARALLSPLDCTATPSTQQPLTYRCQMADERCVVIRPTSFEPVSGPGETR